MEYYNGEERLYFAKVFQNDPKLKEEFIQTFGLESVYGTAEDLYQNFCYALANNVYAQITNDFHSYEESTTYKNNRSFIKDTALIDALNLGTSANEIYEQQIEQFDKYSEMKYTTTWNSLNFLGDIPQLPEVSYTIYKLPESDTMFLYTSPKWNTLKYLGSYANLPTSSNYLDVVFYMETGTYFVYNEGWVNTNQTEPTEVEKLPKAIYDAYHRTFDNTYYFFDGNSTWTKYEYKGTVEALPTNPINLTAYYVEEREGYYLCIITSSRVNPDVAEPRVFLSIQYAVMKVLGLSDDTTPYWYSEVLKPFYITALKSIKYNTIKRFFCENQEYFIPSYDYYLIGQNEKRKALIDILMSEFDRFNNVLESLSTYNDPDTIPDKYVIYFMEMLGFSMHSYQDSPNTDPTFDEMQIRALIKNLMEVYNYKGSAYSFELFFGCMGIDCGIQELYFDRRLYYQTKMNPYTRVLTPSAFAFYLTPKNPLTTSYQFFSGDTVRAIDITNPITSEQWERLINISVAPNAIRTMIGFEKDNVYDFGIDFQEFTYFKTNFLMFNFTSPYNKMKFGSNYYREESDIVSRKEFNAYTELLQFILPVFIKAYYQNIFIDIATDSETMEYGESIKNPKDIFLRDSNVYSQSYNYPTYSKIPEISSGDAEVGDYRVSRYMDGRFSSIHDLPDAHKYDVIGGALSYIIKGKENDKFAVFTTKDGLNLYLLEDSEKLYYSPDRTNEAGDLKTKSKKVSDGVVEQYITRYFWKVNDVSTRIYPELFYDDAEDKNASIDSDQEFFGSDFKPKVRLEEDKLTFNSKEDFNPLLFEHTSYRTSNHVGEVTDTTVEFEYNEFGNPLKTIEVSNLSQELTVTLN